MKIKRDIIGVVIWACACLLTACAPTTPERNKHTGKADGMYSQDPESGIDFYVDVEPGREAVVLQFTDTQIMDASQMREADRLPYVAAERWGKDKMDENVFDCMRQTVKETKPDLILITGDIVFGEFDDNGSALQALVACMESMEIPWAPIFGNHDNESAMGVDWQCEQFVNAKHCLFKQRELTGNGNYTVAIRQDGVVKRVFFMMDSNSCEYMSEASRNGHTTSDVGLAGDQLRWYEAMAERIHRENPEVPLTVAFHIPINRFCVAANILYGYYTEDPKELIVIDDSPIRQATDFGILNGSYVGWDVTEQAYQTFVSKGADSFLFGHEHETSASIVYEGVRLQFGQKTGTYDRANYLMEDGSIKVSHDDIGQPLVGGTVMELSPEDGSIVNSYIYLYQ